MTSDVPNDVPNDDSEKQIGDECYSGSTELGDKAGQFGADTGGAAKKPRSWLYRIGRLATSVPLLTLAILLLLEIWLRQGGNPIDAIDVRSVDGWEAAARLQLCRRADPQVVLIGSSLILALNQGEDGIHYLSGSDPAYLRGLLDKATGQKISCINLASGMQMVSESYLMTEAACNTRQYPGVIIYGVALRDFVQEKLAGEWMTESFNSIAPFAPISAVRNIYSMPGLKEFVFCHYSYLYRNRTDFKNLFTVLAKDFLENLPLDQSFIRLGVDFSWRAQKNGTLLDRWTPRKQEIFFELLRRKHPERLTNYFKGAQTMAYFILHRQAADLSKHYFNCLQELCRRKNILLVVVNMPLSPDITTVVPVKQMTEFRDYLHKGEHDGDYALIDLWADPNFTEFDYKDGVHFNPAGSKKFSDILVQQLQARFPPVLGRMASQAGGKE